MGCGTFILGFVVAAVLASVAVFFLYFYNPNPNTPLDRPPDQVGTPDITATLSQTYLNREIQRQLNGQPFKAGPVEIKDVVLKIQGNSQVEIDLSATSGPASFTLSVTEQVIVQNGRVDLNVIGQPRLTNGTLPPGINSILETVNNQFIEPQINEQVTKIAINQRPIRLIGISSSPGLLTVRANVA